MCQFGQNLANGSGVQTRFFHRVMWPWKLGQGHQIYCFKLENLNIYLYASTFLLAKIQIFMTFMALMYIFVFYTQYASKFVGVCGVNKHNNNKNPSINLFPLQI